MKVKIKRTSPDVPLPQYHTEESAGFDIAAPVDFTIQPNEVVKIPTGLIVASPPGYFLMIAARSSLSLKKGLHMSNGVGIIDPDYAGPEDEIHLILHNITEQPISITKGERLAQGIFLPFIQAEFEESETMREKSRGGMGSTQGYK